MFKINFKKRLIINNLILAFVWSILAIFMFIDQQKPMSSWLQVFGIIIALCYILHSIYLIYFPYIEINEKYILINGPLGRKIPITEIKEIRHKFGDFIIVTEKTESNVAIQSIDSDQIRPLFEQLNSLQPILQ